MKILLTTQPGLGHLHPMVALAYALEQTGHEVAFACAASFIPHLKACNLHAFPAGLDWIESSLEVVFPEARSMSTLEKEAFIQEIFADTIGQMVKDILELSKTWRPDVIVRDCYEYGGCLAAECLGVPHAAIGLDFFVPDHMVRRWLEEDLMYWCSVYGLPMESPVQMLTRHLYISQLPPSYQLPGCLLPPSGRVVCPSFVELSGSERLPEWVNGLPKQPVVYVSLGSVFNQSPEIFETIIKALSDMPVSLIITVGRTQDPAQFKHIAGPHTYIEQFIPQSALMPYCDLAITHGGAGTSLTALKHGLPVVCIPMGGSLLLHAMRCKLLGAGLVLEPPHIFGNELNGPISLEAESSVEYTLGFARALVADRNPIPPFSLSAVRAAVIELLEDARYRQAARQVQAEMVALPGVNQAVGWLEQLVAEHK